MTIWRTQVRFIGAGAIAVAAIYTLARLAKPVVGGLVSTLAASRAEATGDERDRDLSPAWILGADGRVPRRRRVARLHVRALDGARAERGDAHADRRAVRAHRRLPHRRHLRLHGGADRRVEQPDLGRRHPVDRAVRVDARRSPWRRRRRRGRALVAFALFVTAIVFACATISNDNLQDLKTGQLVGASPMRQQIALIVGVAAGAAVIPLVLNLLAKRVRVRRRRQRRRRHRRIRCPRRRRRSSRRSRRASSAATSNGR